MRKKSIRIIPNFLAKVVITFTEKGKPKGKDGGLASGKGGAASYCKLFLRKINIQFDLWNVGDVGEGEF